MTNYEKNFSSNLKRLRTELGFTQKTIAEITGFSEKTISKWECSDSIPDINTLFAIAGLLHTNIDELFRNANDYYYLGIGWYTEKPRSCALAYIDEF